MAQFALNHFLDIFLVQIGDFVQPVDADLQSPQGLLQRLLEGAAYRHDFADRFHLRGQAVVGLRKFFERETRHLGDHVIDGRLERCRRFAAGNFVPQFVERITDRQLRRHFGDRKAGRFRGQRRGARHPRIHFDHHQPAVLRIDRHLHVGTAGIDADFAQHVDGKITQNLIFLIGQGLRRGNGNRIAGVHPHRVEVFDRTNDDAIVLGVAHHLHLEFLPSQH